MNSSVWNSAKKLLMDTYLEQYHVICVQEHRLSLPDSVEVHRWLAGHGWHSVIFPGERTSKGAVSGGVAVLARSYLDACFKPDYESNIIPGRLAASPIRLRAVGEICVYSAYLRVGEGLSLANAQILDSLFAHARAHGRPYIALGDWNMDPVEIMPLVMQHPHALVVHDMAHGT